MKLFIAGLPYDFDDVDLKEMFELYGVVVSAKVVVDRETGRSKGFGFIEMPDDMEARQAIETLDGAGLKGKQLAVKEADEQSRGGGGGGRGPGHGGGGGFRGRDDRGGRGPYQGNSGGFHGRDDRGGRDDRDRGRDDRDRGRDDRGRDDRGRGGDRGWGERDRRDRPGPDKRY